MKKNNIQHIVLVFALLMAGGSLYYLWLHAFNLSYLGMTVWPAEQGWVVQTAEGCRASDCTGTHSIHPGDIIVRLNNASVDNLPGTGIQALVREGNRPVTLTIFRDGEELDILWRRTGYMPEIILPTVIVVFFVASFWVSGLITTRYFYPRDVRWLLMALYLFLHAFWISAGIVSITGLGYASHMLHGTTWLLAALGIHLHFETPVRLGKVKPIVWWGVYAVAALGMVAEFVSYSQPRYLIPLSLHFLVSGAFLAYRLRYSQRERLWSARIMAAGAVISVWPTVVWMLTYPHGNEGWLLASLSLFSFWLWPLFYLYANYRHVLGRYEPAVRKSIVFAGLMVIFLNISALIFHLAQDAIDIAANEVATYTMVSFFVGVLAIGLYRVFSDWINSFIYGRMDEAIDQALGHFSERITDTLDIEALRVILMQEIGEILGIDGMALYLVIEDGMTLVFGQGNFLPDRIAPSDPVLSTLAVYRYQQTDCLAWVRLALPLRIKGDLNGLWLLGPGRLDDFYTREQINKLMFLANEVAASLEIWRQHTALAAQSQQLVEQEKLASLGRMAASVAHQFNNPLQIIQGALEAYGNNENRWLAMAREKTKYLAEVVETITGYARRSPEEMQPIDVKEAIDEALFLTDKLLHNANIRVSVEYKNQIIPTVWAMPSDLTQVLMNLIENACDSMPDGGEICIHTAVVNEGWVEICVSDTGQGIPEEIQDLLFEPFFTTKSGLGFGLFVAYSIIERSRGTIAVESEECRGSTFKIQLPSPI